ncbi:MAG TPA: hypothetical protein VG102_02855 [Candidatus Paceibacterota bacterium]|nr:hypothetical protein [Candidatus Paceibacterota bacterium]
MENPLGRDVSHIKITAVLAVVILVGAGAWQVAASINKKTSTEAFVAADSSGSGAQNATIPDTSGTSTENIDPISAVSDQALGEVVGAYTGLQQEGAYSSTTGAAIADTIGTGLQAPVSYAPIDASQIKTSPDTSYDAMLKYRAALQTSLKPLLKNTEPEYEIFGMYVETKQQTYLDQLHAAAANYVAAASSTALLTVPSDAVQVQLGLVNSMNEFASTLDDLVDHASDPIASTVLLENYNQAENDVLTAFQNLVTYEQSKTQ